MASKHLTKGLSILVSLIISHWSLRWSWKFNHLSGNTIIPSLISTILIIWLQDSENSWILLCTLNAYTNCVLLPLKQLQQNKLEHYRYMLGVSKGRAPKVVVNYSAHIVYLTYPMIPVVLCYRWNRGHFTHFSCFVTTGIETHRASSFGNSFHKHPYIFNTIPSTLQCTLDAQVMIIGS